MTATASTSPIILRVAGKPTGKGRPRFSRQNGGRTYTDTATLSAEERVRQCWREAGELRLDGPLEITVAAVITRPQNHRKSGGELSAAGRREEWPVRRPDLDNVLKLCADALNDCAYKDDAQIVRATVTRRWAAGDEFDHTLIVIRPAPTSQTFDTTARSTNA